MGHIQRYSSVIGKVTGLILLFLNITYALDNNNKESQEQYKIQRYEEMKRKHDRDYKNGTYNDDKKDYVKSWIDEDINYQKRVIKLKSDYMAWAKGKISRGEEVKFYDYEPLKNFTRTEKEILLEYHNLLFKDKIKNKTIANKNIKRKNYKEIEQQKSSDKIQVIINKLNEITSEKTSPVIDTDIRTYIQGYILLGIGTGSIITGLFYLFARKSRIKS